jgi:hypothetical protein
MRHSRKSTRCLSHQQAARQRMSYKARLICRTVQYHVVFIVHLAALPLGPATP